MKELSENKHLLHMVDFYIGEGYKTYQSLSDVDKADLVAQCLSILSPHDAHNVLIQEHDMNDIPDIVHFLKRYLLTSDSMDACDLAEAFKKAAVGNFLDCLGKIFEDRAAILESEENYESGLVPYQYPDNGEIEWRKRA